MVPDDDPTRAVVDRVHLAAVRAAPPECSVVACDGEGLITMIDPGAEQLLGYRAQDVVGQLPLAALHDPAEVATRAAELGIAPGFEVFASAARAGAPETRDWAYVRADGGRLRVSLLVTALRGAGSAVGFVAIAREITAHGGAAAKRLRADDRMLAAFDASPIPTAITRLSDGRILFANSVCLEMLGWREAELVGRTMDEVRFWERPDHRAAMLARVRAEGSVRDLEERVTTKSGERRTVLASISPVDFDGEQCLVALVRDVTEHRRLEAQLRESEDRFRQITETLQQAFVLRGVEPSVVLYSSPAVGTIFGVDRDTLERDASALRALIHPDDRERVLAGRDALTGPTDFEYRIVRPSGEMRWIRTRAVPVRTQHGHVERIATISEDVTDERELRETLRESEERFRLLAENSTDVIARSSLDTTILYISPASLTLYGYEPEEMIGRLGSEFVHPEDLAALREDIAARGERAGDATNEYRVRRRDGSHIWVEAKTHTLRDPLSGEPIEFHTSVRNVSERKQAEAVVRRAKDAAERANHAKSEFLSRMSHELRTPLHAILGFGELLTEDLAARDRDTLAHITRAGRHLLVLINEVLDLSRIESGKLRLSLEPVHVGEVARETLEMVAPLTAGGSVAIVAPLMHELDVHVLADHQRLKQVLLNLLSNAVKYNREHGEVRVRVFRVNAPKARIEVADTGIGIAADDLALVFAPFERLGAEATDVEGTGLGLALVKQLTEAMGGEIGVASELGRGTTFWIELPVVEVQVARPSPCGRPPPAPRPRGPARTVLYVEDNPSNIRLVERILTKRPEVTLLVATDGRLGLELALAHRPALILLDLNLRDVSGEEVLRWIRDDPRTAAIAVVIVSADATPGQVVRLKRAGADAYLTKPFDIEQLLAVVDGAAELGAE